jgi:hypothetical protein
VLLLLIAGGIASISMRTSLFLLLLLAAMRVLLCRSHSIGVGSASCWRTASSTACSCSHVLSATLSTAVAVAPATTGNVATSYAGNVPLMLRVILWRPPRLRLLHGHLHRLPTKRWTSSKVRTNPAHSSLHHPETGCTSSKLRSSPARIEGRRSWVAVGKLRHKHHTLSADARWVD